MAAGCTDGHGWTATPARDRVRVQGGGGPAHYHVGKTRAPRPRDGFKCDPLSCQKRFWKVMNGKTKRSPLLRVEAHFKGAWRARVSAAYRANRLHSLPQEREPGGAGLRGGPLRSSQVLRRTPRSSKDRHEDAGWGLAYGTSDPVLRAWQTPPSRTPTRHSPRMHSAQPPRGAFSERGTKERKQRCPVQRSVPPTGQAELSTLSHTSLLLPRDHSPAEALTGLTPLRRGH